LTDNGSEVECFDENNNKSGDKVVSDMQFETENVRTEDANVSARWQRHVYPEPEKEVVRPETDVDPP
jgi:hypothetical protein